MSARTWLYQKLINDPELTSLVGDRVFAKKSMTSSREEHPYIVYKLGYQANEDISESRLVTRQFCQIFVHDFADGESGDYMRIDKVLGALKRILNNQVDSEERILRVSYLETSQDLDDLTLQTVMKYCRFRLLLDEGSEDD